VLTLPPAATQLQVCVVVLYKSAPVVHVGIATADGPAEPPVAFINKESAAKLLSVNVNAGVVEAFATLLVNSGERFPALNVVTVPELTDEPHAAPASTVLPLASNFTQSLVVVAPVDSCRLAPLPCTPVMLLVPVTVLGTPVVVVFLSKPVARPASDVPLSPVFVPSPVPLMVKSPLRVTPLMVVAVTQSGSWFAVGVPLLLTLPLPEPAQFPVSM